MSINDILKTILIEDLVDKYPFSVNFLSKKGIRCIVCGEPIWGTLQEACEEKGFNEIEIENFVKELNEINKKLQNRIEDSPKDLNIDKLDL